MFTNNKGQAAVRAAVGGALGAAGYLLLSFLTQPGALWGGSLKLDFTFCYNANVPEALGAALGVLLWFCFGAEIALASLPFADDGPALVKRSLLHFLSMAATMTAWAWLNFQLWEVVWFLVPLALIYGLIWLGRWVGWYVEIAAIRQKLGLSPGPSPLKWRESLPYLPFAALMCLVIPMAVRLTLDSPTPIFTAIYAMLILPVGGFFSGLFLGRRQGFCPLYPVMCALLTLCFVLLAKLVSNVADGVMIPIALCSVLLGNAIGALLRTLKGRRQAK